MRADAEIQIGADSACTCLGNARGDSPLCPHSPEKGRSRLCVRDDIRAVEYIRRLHRRQGFQRLRSGQQINRELYGLEWYDLPGYEWKSAELEIEVVEDLLEELWCRELDL